MYGVIRSSWRAEENAFVLDVTIPVNTTATVYVPAASPDAVRESGAAAAAADGVTFRQIEAGRAVYELESGTYSFHSHPAG